MDTSDTLDILPPLTFTQYTFTLRVEEPMRMPTYKGATLRGGFGAVFRRLVCLQPDRRACDRGCRLGNRCPYGYLFETQAPPGSTIVGAGQTAPRPFVLRPPLDPRTRYQPGDRLAFDLILVGRAGDYIPYFIVTFHRLGEIGLGPDRARYRLERVEAVHPWWGKRVTLYREPGEVVADRFLPITSEAAMERAEALPRDRVTLHFLTPARLKRGGRFVTQGPPFPVLMRALLRRLTALAALHGPRPWETDFGALVEASEEVALVGEGAGWQDWRRTSRRQGRRMNLGGLVGRATYRGDLTPFRPLLALGEIVHVGKATVFGDGWYILE